MENTVEREKINLTILSMNIKSLRKKNRLTKSQFAKMLKCSYNTIYLWESGKALPKAESLSKMADIFNLSVNELTESVMTINNSDKNHEGYKDTTAEIAINNVSFEKINKNQETTENKSIIKNNSSASGKRFSDLSKNNQNGNLLVQKRTTTPLNIPAPVNNYKLKAGDIIKVNNVNHLVIAAVDNIGLVTPMMKQQYLPASVNSELEVKFEFENVRYYVYLNLMFIITKSISDQLMLKSSIPEDALADVKNKLIEFVGVSVNNATVDNNNEPDAISLIVQDSTDYINQKNNLSVVCPKGKLSLQQAVDLARKLNISIEELIRDHTDDRKLDEIIEMEEKLKKAQKELDDQREIIRKKKMELGLEK